MIMLKKVNEDNQLHFNNIQTDEIGEGICYVTGGTIKVSKLNRPFLTLFLQDIDGIIIPGYMFDLTDFKMAGLDLTKVTHNLIKVHYRENFLVRYGLTIILDKVELIVNPNYSLLEKYVGSTLEITERFQDMLADISSILNIRVTLPRSITNTHDVEYDKGKLGGTVNHYCKVFKALSAFNDNFNEEDRKQLYGTFVLYIFVHDTYLNKRKENKADINLVTELSKVVSTYMEKLNLKQGAMEVINIFFGYQPKDIFVRLIYNLSQQIKLATNEIELWNSLPYTMEGDIGNGIVKKYT